LVDADRRLDGLIGYATGEKTLKRVLFICTANVCRSPMAEALFNALAEDRGLGFRAESAGVAALKGKPMAPNASAALEEIGVYAEGHSARQVNAKMLEEADLVITMSPWHVAELRRAFGDFFGARTLPEYVSGAPNEEEISDPYGSAMVAYRASLRQLFGYVDLLMERLVQGG
jgi:protein-tyrosine phosphatase